MKPSSTKGTLRRVLTGIVAVAVFVAAYLVLRAREDHGHQPAWGDVPTWLTFVAAALGIPFALYQFNIQRKQLSEQQSELEKVRKRQESQDALLAVQLRQTEVSLQVFKRQQAESIDLTFMATDNPPAGHPAGGYFGVVVVQNKSRRPIRNIAAYLSFDDEKTWLEAVEVGRPTKTMGLVLQESRNDFKEAFIRSGDEWGYKFAASFAMGQEVAFYVEFIDDAGNGWRLDEALSLREVKL